MTYCRISDEVCLKAYEMYLEGATFGELSERFGSDRTAFSKKFRARGWPTRTASQSSRRYTLNERVFADPTPEAAYWVGFIMSDGCVHHAPGGERRLIVNVSERDTDHLNKLRAFLGTDKPLAVKDNRYNNTYGTTPTVSLTITSTLLVADLERFGIKPNKTHTAAARELELNRDFWRGVIDGDGSIFRSRSYWTLSVCGSLSLMEQFRAYCGLLVSSRAKVGPSKSIYQFRLQGVMAAPVVAELYRDAVVALDRKAELARQIYT